MSLVELRNVKKSFRLGGEQVEILHGIDLVVEKGEFVAMMGPSGSGKSTTMNILGCLDKPTSGQYFLDGRDVSELNRDELAAIRNSTIGFVFQGFNLLQRTSAVENVELPMLYAGVHAKERRERAKEALVRMGLGERLYHEPSQLSGGQQQRAAIARSLVYRPALLLADEPTGNLDQKNSREIIDMLKLSNRNLKQTILLITHDEKIALEADRIITIEDGRILSDEKRG